jgi:hypothetical protein
LTTFRGNRIDDTAIWRAFGRLENFDNRKWFARREILNVVHPPMYRLKHFGDRSLSPYATSNAQPTTIRQIASNASPKHVVRVIDVFTRVTTCLLCYREKNGGGYFTEAISSLLARTCDTSHRGEYW